jgi:(E)-4-hydroxy-3-methylbut-2-enyl-diphosphate synthase
VNVGGLALGGAAPIRIQSMTKSDTVDVNATLRQIDQLAKAGCELVRIAVPDEESAAAFRHIKKRARLPLIADVHFDHRLALLALEAGADKIRINPGNIRRPEKLLAIIRSASERHVPIRIGINSGSLPPSLIAKHGGPVPAALVELAQQQAAFFEENGFRDLVFSLKSSSVCDTIEAYRLFSRSSDYPLHLGVTEAGLSLPSAVRSAIGIGCLLLEGIGDTIRVSVTGPPLQEVKIAQEILASLEIRHFGPILISCPTCARTKVNLESAVKQVERAFHKMRLTEPIRVAVMGCAVNGPGEAREADIGVAFEDKLAHIFRKGKVVATVSYEEAIPALLDQAAIITRPSSQGFSAVRSIARRRSRG